MSRELFVQMREVEGRVFDKAYISAEVNTIKNSILDGELDAVEVLISAKKMLELGKQLEDMSRPIAEDRLVLTKGEVYRTRSVDIVEKVVGSKTDYTSCMDPEYNSLQAALADIKEAIKKREAFLSSISTPTTIVTDDGEILTINPPVKYGRLGLSLTLK